MRKTTTGIAGVALVAIASLSAWGIATGAEKKAEEVDISPAKNAVTMGLTRASFAANKPSAETIEAGKRGWQGVYAVLVSPRCMNCHPIGDKPLQTDFGKPHAMNISRSSTANGLECSTCHQEQNSEAIGIAGGPPGAPHWGLPPADMPMVFQGRSARELCEQLKRPADNGFKTMEQLHEHIAKDPLVLWGWNPGGDRSKPPLSHPEFVAAFDAWMASGGACP